MKLDPNAFEDVERDPAALGQAVGVLVLASVSSGIGWIFYGGLTGIVTNAFFSILGLVVWSVIIWLVGTKLMPEPTTKADFPETFRVLGFAAAPGLLSFVTIIPILGWLLLLAIIVWQIAAMIVAVKAVLDYSTVGKAIVVVLIGFVCNLVVTAILSAAFGMRMLMMS
jgi:hypothetical protein